MPTLSLTDTLTMRKLAFAPADPKRVTMYVCGPTPYNFAHIGNARTFVSFDLLFRVLRFLFGAEAVVYARNVTDIDDKLIARAAETGEPMAAIAARYTAALQEDLAALGALAPTLEPRATAHMHDILALTEALIARGAAYQAQSGVYYAVESNSAYGKLSGRDVEDLRTGARVAGEEDKRAPADFALWKAAKPGEPAWEAPFGVGRPGWHIECSAMIRAQLGETIDIHGGGADLVFPHHENEIAQSETATGAPLARVWLHGGFLTMDKEKMSKSLGNVVLARELLAEWDGEVIRWALLAGHYRAPLDFSDALLAQAKASLDRLYGALLRLKDVTAAKAEPPGHFLDALMDDLNTPRAIAALFGLAASVFNNAEAIDKAQVKGELLAAGALMGFLQRDPEAWFRGAGDDAADIDALVAERNAARKAKNFAEADRIRNALTERGIEILDGPSGSTWRRTG
jgi:cysteinyl-tRNA synthetase